MFHVFTQVHAPRAGKVGRITGPGISAPTPGLGLQCMRMGRTSPRAAFSTAPGLCAEWLPSQSALSLRRFSPKRWTAEGLTRVSMVPARARPLRFFARVRRRSQRDATLPGAARRSRIASHFLLPFSRDCTFRGPKSRRRHGSRETRGREADPCSEPRWVLRRAEVRVWVTVYKVTLGVCDRRHS